MLGASILSMLVVARMAYNIEEIRSTARQRDQLRSDLFHEASHDSLTGIANSPYIRQQIGAALRRGRREGTLRRPPRGRPGRLRRDQRPVRARNRRPRPAQRRPAAAGPRARRGHRGPTGRRPVRHPDRHRGLGPRRHDHGRAPVADDQPAGRGVRTERFPISASIGATTSMDGGTDADHLLHEANVAIRRAKASGSGRIEVFDNRLRSEVLERTTIETELRAGLAAGQVDDQLPARRGSAHRVRRGLRGTAPMASSRARVAVARDVHAHRGDDRPHLRDRPLDASRGDGRARGADRVRPRPVR